MILGQLAGHAASKALGGAGKNSMVDPVGIGLSIGGSLLGGLFGKSKSKQQIPVTPTAFAQQSKENQELLQKKLEDYFINAQYGDYFGRPTRRMTLGDVQGDFTPNALFEIQNYFDEQADRAPTQPKAEQPKPNMDVMRAMEMLRALEKSTALPMGGNQGRTLKPLSQIDESALLDLAKQLDGAVMGEGIYRGGLIGKNGVPINLSGFYR